jgi:hypothetical protein
MLSFVVIVRFHPRQTVANAASCTSSVFSNSFHSHSFRTLASHFQTSVSSISFEINRFRTFCKIPGIGYPPLAPHRGRCYPVALQRKRFYPLFLCVVTDPFSNNRGVYPPSKNRGPKGNQNPPAPSAVAVADAPTRSPAGARPPGRLRECDIRYTLLLARS